MLPRSIADGQGTGPADAQRRSSLEKNSSEKNSIEGSAHPPALSPRPSLGPGRAPTGVFNSSAAGSKGQQQQRVSSYRSPSPSPSQSTRNEGAPTPSRSAPQQSLSPSQYLSPHAPSSASPAKPPSARFGFSLSLKRNSMTPMTVMATRNRQQRTSMDRASTGEGPGPSSCSPAPVASAHATSIMALRSSSYSGGNEAHPMASAAMRAGVRLGGGMWGIAEAGGSASFTAARGPPSTPSTAELRAQAWEQHGGATSRRSFSNATRPAAQSWSMLRTAPSVGGSGTGLDALVGSPSSVGPGLSARFIEGAPSGFGTLTCLSPSQNNTSHLALAYAAEAQIEAEGAGSRAVGQPWGGFTATSPFARGAHADEPATPLVPRLRLQEWQLGGASGGHANSPSWLSGRRSNPTVPAYGEGDPGPGSNSSTSNNNSQGSNIQATGPGAHPGNRKPSAPQSARPASAAMHAAPSAAGTKAIISGAALAARRARKAVQQQPPSHSAEAGSEEACEAIGGWDMQKGSSTPNRKSLDSSEVQGRKSVDSSEAQGPVKAQQGAHSAASQQQQQQQQQQQEQHQEQQQQQSAAQVHGARHSSSPRPTSQFSSPAVPANCAAPEARPVQADQPGPKEPAAQAQPSACAPAPPKPQLPAAASPPPPPTVPPLQPTPPPAPASAVQPPAAGATKVASAGQESAPIAAGPTGPTDHLLPPLGFPGTTATYMALLGCDVNEEHTAALPGYTVGKVIGEGGFCQVRVALHHLSKRKVAVKVIDKAKLTDPNEAKRIQREIRVMYHLTHECVIKLFDVVDAPTMLYLIMEHAPNQSLLDYVRSRKRLSESRAALILLQIVAGLQYCHQREVVHRDVKLENILMGSDSNMKLVDFGLSAFFIPGKRLRVHCGSPSYAAPEIVARKQYDGPPVDVWSLGVVLFAMLAGHLPFHASGGNKQELCQKIMDGRFTMPEYLSGPAKDILNRMLTVEPERRITFAELQLHPFVDSARPWLLQKSSVYSVDVDPDTNTVLADERLVTELVNAGYTREVVLQNLLSHSNNYLTTSYFLLAEAKAERTRAIEALKAGTHVARGSTAYPPSGAPAAATRRPAAVAAVAQPAAVCG